MSIPILVPDVEVLLRLEPSEIGAVMLELLNQSSPQERPKFTFGHHFRDERLAPYPPNRRDHAARCLAEGWTWLLRESLIAPDPEDNYAMWHFVTRRGATLRTREHVEAYARAALFPRSLLHPLVQAKSESSFSRGEYDTAVFQAFKEFEIAVRTAGGFDENDFGVELMRKAFNDANGPLGDPTVPATERQALAHLCAGAIGSYKNPHSHRNVAIDAEQATEMLVLARIIREGADFGRDTNASAW